MLDEPTPTSPTNRLSRLARPAWLAQRRLSGQQAQWLLVVGLVLLLLIVGSQHTLKVSQASRLNTQTKSALLRWLPQVQDASAGRDIWADYNFPNPPIVAMLLVPLASLPPLAASLVWLYAKVLLTVWAILWVFRLVESPQRPFPVWAKVLALLLSLRPILGDLSHGNINLLILFLIVAMLRLDSQRRDWSAGLVLGLAIACKVTPALFVPYFLWKRAWRVVAGAALSLAVCLFVVPALWLGPERNLQGLHSWTRGMIAPYLTGVDKASAVTVSSGTVYRSIHYNQSLPATLHRLLTTSHSFSTFEGDTFVPLRTHALLELDPASVRWLVKLALVGFALLMGWVCRADRHTARPGARVVAEYAIIALGMLIFSERTWKHHCVSLLLPYAVLCYTLAYVRSGLRWRLGLVLTASLGLIMVTSPGLLGWTVDVGGRALSPQGLLPVYDEASAVALVYSPYLGAFLLLLLGCIGCVRAEGGAWVSPPPDGEPASAGPTAQCEAAQREAAQREAARRLA